MQTPDQSSEENQPPVDHSSETSDVTNHLEEIPSASNDLPEQLERQKSAHKAVDNEAIRRGLIYPPPPIFYEEMSLPVASPHELKPQAVPTHETTEHADNVPRDAWN